MVQSVPLALLAIIAVKLNLRNHLACVMLAISAPWAPLSLILMELIQLVIPALKAPTAWRGLYFQPPALQELLTMELILEMRANASHAHQVNIAQLKAFKNPQAHVQRDFSAQ